jgi:site-specific DNA-methyltransferase (adenine-specific)
MALMSRYPDKYFELAIVDPPYGLGDKLTSGGTWAAKLKASDASWDFVPGAEYFNELFRVSKNQIIWGGNYFQLPPCRGFLVWDKKLTDNWTLAMCEFAWASFDKPSKMFRASLSQGVRKEGDRIHVCQKPISLYRWILSMYAKEGDKILDTHLGSGSSRIAAYDMGFDFTASELDKDYFDAQEKRFKDFVSQLKMDF